MPYLFWRVGEAVVAGKPRLSSSWLADSRNVEDAIRRRPIPDIFRDGITTKRK